VKLVTTRTDGLKVIHNGDVSLLIHIPSRGRADRIINHPFASVGNIFVHEPELPSYGRSFAKAGKLPGCLVPHNVDGHLGKIRNFMNDHRQGESFVIQLDDDYAGMHNLFTMRRSQTKITDVNTIVDIFTQTYMLASDAGTGLFCYAQTPTPWERHSYAPMRLRGWGMAACMGFLRTDVLRFDEGLRLKVDVDMCLTAIKEFGFLIQDMRFWGWCDESGSRTGADVGGLANFRTTHTEEAAVRYLQDKWGEGIISYNGAKKRGLGIAFRANIPQSYDD